MKTSLSKKIVLAASASLLCMIVPAMVAQTPRAGSQQLQSPVVIPSTRTVQAPAGQIQPPSNVLATSANAAAPSPAQQTQQMLSPQGTSNSGNAALSLSNDLSASPTAGASEQRSVILGKPARDGLTEAQRTEMVSRMRSAVQQIASEYGNPTFAQIFTNDQVQAQILRKRIQMLQRVENMQQEIAVLDKQKQQAQQDVAATRREMTILQDQADALTARIQKARRALDLASQ